MFRCQGCSRNRHHTASRSSRTRPPWPLREDQPPGPRPWRPEPPLSRGQISSPHACHPRAATEGEKRARPQHERGGTYEQCLLEIRKLIDEDRGITATGIGAERGSADSAPAADLCDGRLGAEAGLAVL